METSFFLVSLICRVVVMNWVNYPKVTDILVLICKCRSEVQHESQWAKIKMLGGLHSFLEVPGENPPCLSNFQRVLAFLSLWPLPSYISFLPSSSFHFVHLQSLQHSITDHFSIVKSPSDHGWEWFCNFMTCGIRLGHLDHLRSCLYFRILNLNTLVKSLFIVYHVIKYSHVLGIKIWKLLCFLPKFPSGKFLMVLQRLQCQAHPWDMHGGMTPSKAYLLKDPVLVRMLTLG